MGLTCLQLFPASDVINIPRLVEDSSVPMFPEYKKMNNFTVYLHSKGSITHLCAQSTDKIVKSYFANLRACSFSSGGHVYDLLQPNQLPQNMRFRSWSFSIWFQWQKEGTVWLVFCGCTTTMHLSEKGGDACDDEKLAKPHHLCQVWSDQLHLQIKCTSFR